jgi:hypothetical protein
MDGMHRVLKALTAGMETIDAFIFDRDPAPDYVDVYPEQLPYKGCLTFVGADRVR